MRLLVIVTPGARRSAVVGRHGDGWKVRVTAPPERGRANAALLAFLADTLGVRESAVRLLSGQSARRKVVEIDELSREEAGRRLTAAARHSL